MRIQKLDASAETPRPGWKITPRADGDERVERWTRTIRGVLGFVWRTEHGWFWLVFDCSPITPRWKILAKGHASDLRSAMDACDIAAPLLN